MGIPDMKIPIAYALTYPERIINDLPSLNLAKTGNLEFLKPDIKNFPAWVLLMRPAFAAARLRLF